MARNKFDDMAYEFSKNPARATRFGLIVVGALLALVLLVVSAFKSYTSVEAGHVGVVTTLGAISKTPLEQGPHFIIPWVQKVVPMETRLKAHEVPKSAAASKDLQVVHTQVTVQHFIDGAMAPEAYQVIGDLDAFDRVVVEPAVQESIKAVTAKYTAEELVTKRDIVKQQMVEEIQRNIDKTLGARNLKNALHIDNVSVRDFEFSDSFNRSVDAKVKAGQDVQKALNQKNKAITTAEGERRKQMIAADAEAYQITEVSKAKAAAIIREAKAIEKNPDVVELRLTEKWNGRLPTMVVPGQSLRLTDLLRLINPPATATPARPVPAGK